MSEENEPHWVDPLAEHDRPWHTHNAWDNRGMTDEQLTDPTWRAQVDAMTAGALERAQQPAQVDDSSSSNVGSTSTKRAETHSARPMPQQEAMTSTERNEPSGTASTTQN